MTIQVLVFLSEIKFDLILKKKKNQKKIKFSVSFMHLFYTIIKLLPTFRPSHQKTNFFLAISHQLVIFSLFRRYNIG